MEENAQRMKSRSKLSTRCVCLYVCVCLSVCLCRHTNMCECREYMAGLHLKNVLLTHKSCTGIVVTGLHTNFLQACESL